MPLVLGNHKLGKTIYHWSIRTMHDCPGRTPTCEKWCYNKFGKSALPKIRKAHAINRMISDMEWFPQWMSVELAIREAKVVRIHADGDFYDADYVKKWIKVVKENPHIKFFAYTRSWQVDAIRKELVQLSDLKNFQLWYSLDKDTGIPKNVPKSVKTAWMQIDEKDIPPGNVDLVFRVAPLRKKVAKKVSHGMVCPVENGIKLKTKMTCDKCKFCFRNALVENKKRIPLPVV